LRSLHENIKDLILHVRRLTLDRGDAGRECSDDLPDIELLDQLIRRDGIGASGLTKLTRQKRDIGIDFTTGHARRFGRAATLIRHSDGEARAPDYDASALVAYRDLTEQIDDARSIFSMRDRRRAAADANRGDRRVDGRGALMADVSAYEAKRALGERRSYLADAGCWIVDKIVDDEIAVGANAQGGLVQKQQLSRADIGCLDPLLVHDPRA
jgi:hypothetical protein